MFVAYESRGLLGSYRKQDYSPSFQYMINRVVTKIEKYKGSKKIVLDIHDPQILVDARPSPQKRSLRKSSFQSKQYRSLESTSKRQQSKVKSRVLEIQGRRKQDFGAMSQRYSLQSRPLRRLMTLQINPKKMPIACQYPTRRETIITQRMSSPIHPKTIKNGVVFHSKIKKKQQGKLARWMQQKDRLLSFPAQFQPWETNPHEQFD